MKLNSYVNVNRGPFHKQELTLIPAGINNHMPCKVRWNYLSIPKRLRHWSLETTMYFHPTLYNGCNYLSGFKLIITMTSEWARLRLKSPASPLFTQPFIRAQIKENIKAPRRWPFVNSPHKWLITRKMFPFDDVIMIHVVKRGSRTGSDYPLCNRFGSVWPRKSHLMRTSIDVMHHQIITW